MNNSLILCYVILKLNLKAFPMVFSNFTFYKKNMQNSLFNRNVKKSKFPKHDFTPVALEDSIQVNLTFETK